MPDGLEENLQPLPRLTFAPEAGGRRSFRRYTVILLLSAALPMLAVAGFVIGIDPYYVFGSPSVPGINALRPFYEPHVLTAKPYQMRRIKPEAVTLGSSRVEVGLDPRHPAWGSARTFNFGMPSSTSYETMLSLLHTQAVSGKNLKRAVVGLDFFGFNIFFPRNHEQQEARFAGDGVAAFADFLETELQTRKRNAPPAIARPDPNAWNEALYLAINPDVAAAVKRKDFKSGREHYELAGRAERRLGATIPPEWDELGYMQVNPDVAWFTSLGNFVNGYHHYIAAGRAEGRLGGIKPRDWNEKAYLAANPSARIRIALGDYHNGYAHYASVGRTQGLLGGFPVTNTADRLLLHWPTARAAAFQIGELWHMTFSKTILKDSLLTIAGQSGPPSFNEKGMRIWAGQDEIMARTGGNGGAVRGMVLGWRWYLWLMPPRYMYCFTNADTGMTMFDPFRFMLRRAYETQTDLRMYTTPLHAAVRTLFIQLGLGKHYDFWIKEMVRINEEEAARAGRPPFPLWDFSDTNMITMEAVPERGKGEPMRGYWEASHYRKAIGDLILDRVLGHSEAPRSLPADFGVRLTADNIDAHLIRSNTGLAHWAAKDELGPKIAEAMKNPQVQNNQAKATCW